MFRIFSWVEFPREKWRHFSLCIPQVPVLLSHSEIGRQTATMCSVDKQKDHSRSYNLNYHPVATNSQASSAWVEGSKESNGSGKVLPILPHLLNQAVLSDNIHQSHYTQLYWVDLWNLDLETRNLASTTFLPSFQEPALLLIEWKAR